MYQSIIVWKCKKEWVRGGWAGSTMDRGTGALIRQ